MALNAPMLIWELSHANAITNGALPIGRQLLAPYLVSNGAFANHYGRSDPWGSFINAFLTFLVIISNINSQTDIANLGLISEPGKAC